MSANMRMKRGIQLARFVPTLSLVFLLFSCSSSNETNPAQTKPGGFFPSFLRPSHLYVIGTEALDGHTMVLMQTLQGIVAQTQPEIYIDEPGTGYSIWLEDLADHHGIGHEVHDDPWWFVEHFKDRLADGGSYILYDPGEESENVATSLSGILGAVAVAADIEATAQEHGLSRLLDAREKTEAWLFENYRSRMRDDLFLFQRASSHNSLREFSAATGAALFHMDCLSGAFKDWIKPATVPFPVIGWAGRSDQCLFEHGFVRPFTMMGGFVLPSDKDKNLSTLSGVDNETPLRQRGHGEVTLEDDVHYATFVVSDGDNKGWVMRGFATNERLFANPIRGDFDLGWTMPPLLGELAPTVLEWIYREGATFPAKDFFIAGVSGIGYIYPDLHPDLTGYCERMGPYLDQTDMHIVNLMLFSPGGFRSEVIKPFARRPEVHGCLAINYAFGYDLLGGEIVWAAGKPAVGARFAMCEDCSVTAKGPVEIACGINALPTDPTVPEGYSFVIVQPWSYGLDDVAGCIAALEPDVRVVTPEAFVQAVHHFRPGAP